VVGHALCGLTLAFRFFQALNSQLSTLNFPLPSDRQLIETDKAVLRRTYANDPPGLAALKAYAATLYNSSPSDVELTGATREGVTGSGQISNNLRLRRIAVEELIAERDPDYLAPAPLPRRSMGVTVRLGT
jgi:hypothetical protein